LDERGYLYTSGSSEYGQTASGETGEYFVSANKLAFANAYGFERQSRFVQDDNGDDAGGHRSSSTQQGRKVKTVDGTNEIALQDISCGKHHTVALEAPRDGGGPAPRVFTWGCGDYGCLGHGVQKDEYFPRLVEQGFIPGMIGVKVSAGAHCSLLLTEPGHVYYWGKHRSVGEATMRPLLVDALANNSHIVTHLGAGAQTVVCTTSLGATVVWGQGQCGELGIGEKKSSAKPTFVDSLNGKQILDVSCGLGSVLYVVQDDKDLPKIDIQAVEAAMGGSSSANQEDEE
jgi:alpha-tubulin suppressor-like RCC1 family protein